MGYEESGAICGLPSVMLLTQAEWTQMLQNRRYTVFSFFSRLYTIKFFRGKGVNGAKP